MTITLHLGDWRETMLDTDVDAMITDPPYSSTTHDGQRATHVDGERNALAYASIDDAYCREFVNLWRPRVRAWWVVFGDHTTVRWWRDAMAGADLYTFAPVVWVKRNPPPRFTGDGPASACEYMAVGRPSSAEFQGWGSLPGYYEATTAKARPGVIDSFHGVTGAKPIDLMRALVRDYTKPGWTIADPHCGSGTTAVAARAEGRACVTSEVDPTTHDIARRRLNAPVSLPLFPDHGAA